MPLTPLELSYKSYKGHIYKEETKGKKIPIIFIIMIQEKKKKKTLWQFSFFLIIECTYKCQLTVILMCS